MTITPSAQKTRVTQAWLNQQFNDQGWAEQLGSYTRVEIHNSVTPAIHGQVEGTLTVGHDYYDAENKLVATVFYFLKPDGNLGASGLKTPKGLLINGVWCYT
jgi:carbohydrate-selective porin OprB